MILKEIGSRCSFWGKFGFSAWVESGLNIEQQIDDFLWYRIEYLVWIDDSVFGGMMIWIFGDDDGASIFYFVEFKGIFVLLCKFDIFEEESDVFLCDMLVLIVIFLFDKLFFKLVSTYPRKKFDSEFSTLEDHVFEMQFNLLNRRFSICLQIAKFRVFHIIIIITLFTIAYLSPVS